MTLDEALAAMDAEGLSARGVRITIVDTGFSGLESASIPYAAADFSRGAPTLDDHGTQVALLLHTVVPDAALTLVSVATEADVIEVLAGVDADLVNLSLGWVNSDWANGSSALSLAVDDADALVVVAAGNEGGHFAVGTLSGGPDPVALNGIDGFSLSGLTRLRWSEPFGAADEDLALVASDASGTCATSDQPQDGTGDPLETLDLRACQDATLRIIGAPEGRTEAWLWSESMPEALRTRVGTLSRPGDARHAITVGAWVDGAVPDWSSRGPTDDGRDKPEIVAPGEIETPLGTFTGTSAATALATGVLAAWAAQAVEVDDTSARAWLESTATPVGEGAGYGLVRGPAPVGCATVRGGGWGALGGIFFAWVRRRSADHRAAGVVSSTW